MIAAVVISNVERIPLTLSYPGGIALIIAFINCPQQCKKCPWNANLSNKNAKVIELSPSNLINLVKRYNPDIVFFHGAEPYLYPYSKSLLTAIRREFGNLCIGMKIIPSIAFKNLFVLNQIVNLIDIILVEVIDIESIEALTKLKYLFEDMHLEIVILINIDNIHHIEEFVVMLSNMFKNKIVPINLILAEEVISNSLLLKIIDKLRNIYPFISIPSSPSTDLASILCPRCKTYVILRQSFITMKINTNSEGKCKYCGYKCILRLPKKIVKIPIEEVII